MSSPTRTSAPATGWGRQPTCLPGQHHWTLQALGIRPDQGAHVTYTCGLCRQTVTRPMQAEDTHALAQMAQARLALQVVLARLNDGCVS